MSSTRPTIVHARGAAPAVDAMHRIEESSVDAVLAAIDRAPNEADVVVAVDAPATVRMPGDSEAFFDHDLLVALVAVLVVRGVQAFETRAVPTVRRILDMHSAITAGAIEVLET